MIKNMIFDMMGVVIRFDTEKYYNDHYAICNRAVLDGQELSDIAYIDHPNGVKEEKSNRITIVIP